MSSPDSTPKEIKEETKVEEKEAVYLGENEMIEAYDNPNGYREFSGKNAIGEVIAYILNGAQGDGTLFKAYPGQKLKKSNFTPIYFYHPIFKTYDPGTMSEVINAIRETVHDKQFRMCGPDRRPVTWCYKAPPKVELKEKILGGTTVGTYENDPGRISKYGH